MKLASLIMPIRDNAGVDASDVHRALQLVLVDSFGGFTVTPAQGAWRDDTGRVIFDESRAYSIAMDDTDSNRAKMESIARFYGHMAGQICVMVTHADGDVVMVDVVPAQFAMELTA